VAMQNRSLRHFEHFVPHENKGGSGVGGSAARWRPCSLVPKDCRLRKAAIASECPDKYFVADTIETSIP